MTLERLNIPPVPGIDQDFLLHSNYQLRPEWSSQDQILGRFIIRNLSELIANASSSIGDTIWLKPNYIYQFQGIVNVGSATVYPNLNTRIEGRYASYDQIVGDTTNSVVRFSLNNSSTTLRNITIYNSNSIGTACTFEGTGSNLSTQFTLLTGYKGLVTNTCNSIVCENFVTTTNKVSGNGFEFNGPLSTILLSVGSCINTIGSASSIVFNSGSSATTATFEKNTFFLGDSSTNGIYVKTGSNVNVGRVKENSFRNQLGGIPVKGFDHSTNQWIFDGNYATVSTSSIKDSDIHLAANFFSTASIVHTVSASGQYQIVADPNIVSYLSERIQQLTGSQKNNFMYTGTLPRDVQASANLTCNMSAPGDVRLGFGFIYNGQIVSSSIQLMGANKGTYGAPPVTISTNFELNNGDTFAPVIANLTDTTNIEIYSLQVTIVGNY